MGKYGQAAVKAVSLVNGGPRLDPIRAWNRATSVLFGSGSTSQKKSCPRDAFLGLCQAGLVRGVPAGQYTRSQDNAGYAVAAARLLHQNASLANLSCPQLWARVLQHVGMRGSKTHNGQMDVVLSLFQNSLL